MPVSLDCPFLIAPSVFSNFYLQQTSYFNYIVVRTNFKRAIPCSLTIQTRLLKGMNKTVVYRINTQTVISYDDTLMIWSQHEPVLFCKKNIDVYTPYIYLFTYRQNLHLPFYRIICLRIQMPSCTQYICKYVRIYSTIYYAIA